MGGLKEILIVGGGIGGLTLALELHRRKIPCRVPRELAALSERYKQVAGYDRRTLQGGQPQ